MRCEMDDPGRRENAEVKRRKSAKAMDKVVPEIKSSNKLSTCHQ